MKSLFYLFFFFAIIILSVERIVYRFALPIILINLLQAVYSVVDMIIVGQFTGASGMVAVSQGGQIVMIIFCSISAFSNAESQSPT